VKIFSDGGYEGRVCSKVKDDHHLDWEVVKRKQSNFKYYLGGIERTLALACAASTTNY